MASLVIACASDVRYALPLTVMLRSVLENLGPAHRVEVYAVDDGISPADKSKVLASLTDQVAIHWIEPTRSSLSGLPTWGRMPVTTYQKLTLGEWLPAHIEKVLWLDCDLLVLDDIVPLWDVDLGQWHALAVPDQRVPMVSSRFGVAAYRELHLPADTRYFNAGVLLIDLSRWRKDDVAGRSMDYLIKYRDRVFFWDQEALNAVLAGKVGELDDGWNRNPTIEHLLLGSYKAQQRSSKIRIAHYSGNLKPWNSGGTTRHHDLYFQYLDRTAWRGWRPARTLKGACLNSYESSRLRRFMYPAEQWATQLVRTLTRN